jgi:hypothetical protein
MSLEKAPAYVSSYAPVICKLLPMRTFHIIRSIVGAAGFEAINQYRQNY